MNSSPSLLNAIDTESVDNWIPLNSLLRLECVEDNNDTVSNTRADVATTESLYSKGVPKDKGCQLSCNPRAENLSLIESNLLSHKGQLILNPKKSSLNEVETTCFLEHCSNSAIDSRKPNTLSNDYQSLWHRNFTPLEVSSSYTETTLSKKFKSQEVSADDASIQYSIEVYMKNLLPLCKVNFPSLEVLLELLIAPRYTHLLKGGQKRYIVSTNPATRNDVLNLEYRLNQQLEIRRANLQGICSIRYQLIQEIFDELIRQVMIDCAERGILLVRIRDEAHLTLEAHRRLVQHAIQLGSQKYFDDSLEMESKIKALQEKKRSLTLEFKRLLKESEDYKVDMIERRNELDTKRQNQFDFYKKANVQLEECIALEKKQQSKHPSSII